MTRAEFIQKLVQAAEHQKQHDLLRAELDSDLAYHLKVARESSLLTLKEAAFRLGHDASYVNGRENMGVRWDTIKALDALKIWTSKTAEAPKRLKPGPKPKYTHEEKLIRRRSAYAGASEGNSDGRTGVRISVLNGTASSE
jgi:hypothetical protein